MRLRQPLVLGLLACMAAAPAFATTITYTATPLGGSAWRYDYAVTNDSLGVDISEFTAWFDRDLYANLAVAGSPASWDSIVAQPDANLPADGFFDSLALAAGIAPDATLGGFAVTFTYLGAGSPGAQPFEVVDPGTFAVLSSGTTAAVPAPGAALLLATGLLALGTRLRRRAARGI